MAKRVPPERSKPNGGLVPGGELETIKAQPRPDLHQLSQRHIVVLLHGLNMGGAERQAMLLVQTLRDRWSSNVEVWSLTSGEWGEGEARNLGVPVRVLGFGTPTTAVGIVHMAVGLGRRLATAKVENVVPFLELPNLLGNLAWKFSRTRGCLWNQRNTESRTYHRLLERLAIRMSGAIVANSKAALETITLQRGSARRPAFVVYNGVELAKPKATRPEWRSKLGVSAPTFVVCMVANLTRFKDHDTLVYAWRRIVDTMTGSRTDTAPVLVLAGRHGETTSAVRQVAESLGVSNTLRFPGHVDDVSGLLAAVDLGVLSSVSEGCPNAVLEYMAAGLPLVACDLPAIREIVPGENLRYLVPAKAPEPLANAILSLISDRAAGRTAGDANFRHSQRRFSIDSMAEGMAAAILASDR